MAVEASINAKKATPLYKQNIIGKGITTLDDFSDYSSVSVTCLSTKEKKRMGETILQVVVDMDMFFVLYTYL